jgi:hypothetical protein
MRCSMAKKIPARNTRGSTSLSRLASAFATCRSGINCEAPLRDHANLMFRKMRDLVALFRQGHDFAYENLLRRFLGSRSFER